jgi:selenocysteine lyase/cysteine desulfurase
MQAVTDTAMLDELRRSDYVRLDAGGHVYLDYTGAGLYADSQLAEHLALLRSTVFGNPHSLNPTSAAMTELVEQARAAVLDFFRASPKEYAAIFTPNATGALRLVGEAYPFGQAIASCSPSTITTRSTGSASSPARAAQRRPMCRASPLNCASTRISSHAT